MSCRPSSPPPPLSSVSTAAPGDPVESHRGGLDDAIFVDPPSQSRGLHCPICFLILRDPILLSCCGKHICEVCIDPIVVDGQPCPCCREQSFTRLLNKEKKQDILSLRVYCSNKELGCEWTGELCNEARHLNTKCEFVPKYCQYKCGEKFLCSHIHTHEQYECVNRPIQVILEVFMKQANEKMAKQDQILTELSEKLKEYQEREQEMMREIQELKDRETISELEIVEENVYVEKGVWQFACSTAFKKNWFDMVEQMHSKGITLSLNEDNSCMTIRGERKALSVGRTAIAEFQTSVQSSRIDSVHHDATFYLANYENAIKEIENELKVHIELEQHQEVVDEVESTVDHIGTHHTTATSINVCTATTSRGQSINLYTGDMKVYTEADVVVCYCNDRLEGVDEVSQVIMDTVGGDLVREKVREHQGEGVQSPYSVLVPCDGSASVKAMVLAVVPYFNESLTSPEKYFSMVRRTIRSIFKHCNVYASVVMASMGQGTPQQALYANALLHEISSYFDNSQTELKTVDIFILDSEIEVFTKNLEFEFDSINTHTVSLSRSIHDNNGKPSRFLRMLPNGVLFRVLFDDITNQQVDVIVVVTSTMPDLARVGNCITETLLSKGGKELRASRDNQMKQGLRPSEGKPVETRCEGMGALVCKSLFYTVLNTPDLKRSVLWCLERAEKMKYTSIAFPRIWSKEAPLNKVIANLKNALKQFTRRNPSSVKVINMMFLNRVTFERFQEVFGNDETLAMDNSFYTSPMSMKTSTPSKATPTSNISRENSSNKSMNDCSNLCFHNPAQSSTSSVTIYGLDTTLVEAAKNKLQTLIDILV